VYEIAVTGLGSSEPRSTVTLARTGGTDARPALTPAAAGIVFEQVSAGSFTEGARGADGQRYGTFTFRVRNGTGAPLSNLTLLMVSRPSTIAGTPISSLRRFDGAQADPAIAPYVVPTGAVSLPSDQATLQGLSPDVLQVFEESEVADIPLPGDVMGIFPYGFVVRAASPDATTRTLPAAASANQYDGVLTLSFRLPLQAAAGADVASITFQVIAVEDGETRVTESLEEAQDSTSVRRLRERAAALGATTVTVLAGSPAAGADGADYPGQRQLCSVRTAGTPEAPTTFITTPAAYTRLGMLRPGESPSACGAGFRAGTPDRPTLNVPYPLTVQAMDRYGNVIAGAADTVGLAQTSGPAATFGAPAPLAGGQASVEVTYLENGASRLNAVGRRNRGQREIEVATEATVVVSGGSNQAATAGSAVPTAPSVLVRDLTGIPLPGVPVTFAVTSGGGSLTGAQAVTDASGVATAGSWVLGSPAARNTLTATAAGAATPATFTASGCAGGGGTGFGITLCYVSAVTPTQRALLEAAAARWEDVVTGDLPDLALSRAAATCGALSPSFDLSIDDLLVFVSIQEIDGPAGFGASGGWCYRRTGSLPLVGLVRFDAADLASMEASGVLQAVMQHELGHALGVGTMWSALGLLVNPSPVGGPPLDTYLTGSGAAAGFDLIGGTAYTGGQKVPVENTGASGSANVHWRESVLANELMTPYVSVVSPLSQLTVRSLADLGYTVDTTKADPFFLTLSLGAGGIAPGAVSLAGDVPDLPQYSVDAKGRATRIR
jgi:hypothetical protein